MLNTDAEGRLTLADALVYAEKNCKAEAIIDVATLTGACMVALGTSMCGMFSPNQQLISQLKQAGSRSGGLFLFLGAMFIAAVDTTTPTASCPCFDPPMTERIPSCIQG